MKKVKTSSHQIKNSRVGLQKANVVSDKLRTEFELVYDKDYPKNHIIYGLVEVFFETLKSNKKTGEKEVNEELVYCSKKVLVSNYNQDLAKIDRTFRPQLKGRSPGRVLISNCSVAGKAHIEDEFKD